MMVKVYRYKVTDPRTGYDRIADRMGMIDFIENLAQGWPIYSSQAFVPASQVDESGKTAIGFRA
jgi:hypothetical protein